MTPMPDKWDDYCFDLEGFLILENAVQPELIAEINEKVDEWLVLSDAGEEWLGNVHVVRNESDNSHSVSFRNVIVHLGKRNWSYQFNLRLSLRHDFSRNPEGFKPSLCMSDGNLYAPRLTPRCNRRWFVF